MNAHKPRFRAVLTGLWLTGLLGFFFCSATASDAQTFTSHKAHLVEDTYFSLSSPALFPQEKVESLTILTEPRHGIILNAPPGLEYVYVPDPGFQGFDTLSFEVRYENIRASITLEVRLRVLPRVLPIAGVFDDSDSAAFGFYYLEERVFFICSPGYSTGVGSRSTTRDSEADAPLPPRSGGSRLGTLSCKARRVPEAKPGWLPLVGDWDGLRRNLAPSLFDPTTGTLHRLMPNRAGNSYSIADSVVLPDASWTWPLAGDWFKTGFDQLSLYRDNGSVSTYENPFSNSKKAAHDWPAFMPLYRGLGFPWPYDTAGRVPTIAFPDGTYRHWMTLGGNSGSVQVVRPFVGIPVVHTGGLAGNLGLMAFLRHNGHLWFFSTDDIDGQTIALKFPNDPPDP